MAHPEGPWVTILPFVDEGLGNSSYLVEIGDGRSLAAGHIPGALSIALRSAFASWLGWIVAGSLHAMASGFATDAVTMMCGHGERAATAASLLERSVGRPSVFVGGAGDWARALGRPLATGA